MNTIDERSGILLVGMPGAGKSTVGVLLAKEFGLDFIDSDILIQVQTRRTLQQLIDDEGYLALRAIEEKVLIAEKSAGRVIATGG